MSDALEIANLKARYCAAGDSAPHDAEGAATALRACLVPDATADYGFTQFDDPEKLIAFMTTAVGGGSEWMIHMLGSPRIEVAGDTATGDWTVAVHAKRKDGETMLIVGRYSDCFARTANGWLISHIKFERYE
ncbi:MAG: nuclear transport factor 2 family protein [Novosphingobium sp.]|nr:nuclear transport factor 2 family protein [Novosphingobium sp.]